MKLRLTSARILIVNDVLSKAYAMTGWRLGWGIGPRELIATMVGVQGQSTSGACSISQAAAIAALTGPQDVLSERLASFKERRDYVVDALNKTRRLDCLTPGGAFYVFPSCVKTFGLKTPDGTELTTDAEFCEYHLSQCRRCACARARFRFVRPFSIVIRLCDGGSKRRLCAYC